MKKIVICMFFSIALTMFIKSQPVNQWSRFYDFNSFSNREQANDMLTDASGNIYLTGFTDSSFKKYDIVTIKYNASGVLQWAKKFDWGGYNDLGYYINEDRDGNLYVSGTFGVSTTQSYIGVVKYSPSGTMLWSKKFVPTPAARNNVEISSTVMTGGKLVIASRYDTYTPANSSDIEFFIINTDGTYISQRISNPNVFRKIYQITADAGGNIYAAGYIKNGSSSSARENGYLTKFNSSLVLQWTKTIVDSVRNSTIFKNIKVNSYGQIIVSGEAYNNYGAVITWSKGALISAKIKNNSSTYWYRRYSKPDSGYVFTNHSMLLDANDNIIMGGANVKGLDWLLGSLVKYDLLGNLIWTRDDSYGSFPRFNSYYRISIDNSRNIYAIGHSKMIKVSESGSVMWVQTLAGAFLNIKWVSPNLLYVGGTKFITESNSEFALEKYNIPSGSRPAGIEPETEPQKFSLEDNYPNPFNPQTTIKFALPVGGSTTLKVYDITGKEVASLVEEVLEAGNHEVNFNASQLSSGTYFYRITSGSFTDVKKMMLVK